MKWWILTQYTEMAFHDRCKNIRFCEYSANSNWAALKHVIFSQVLIKIFHATNFNVFGPINKKQLTVMSSTIKTFFIRLIKFGHVKCQIEFGLQEED